MAIRPVVSEILGGWYPPDVSELSKIADAITVQASVINS